MAAQPSLEKQRLPGQNAPDGMERMKLFYAPGACSRVALNALEELGVPFEEHPLALLRGEQKTPEYLAINPFGKVPALQVGKRIVTESTAILFYLATLYPAGKLLPNLSDPVGRAQALGDLAWCASTLHPMVRQIYLPQLFTVDDVAPVRACALQNFALVSERIVERLSGRPWWYGDDWSIIDVYLCWIMGIARLGKTPQADLPVVADHTQRVRARPSFVRALAREKAAVNSCGIPLPPGVDL